MLYNLSLHLNPLLLSVTVSATIMMFIILLVKEKKDERKRA